MGVGVVGLDREGPQVAGGSAVRIALREPRPSEVVPGRHVVRPDPQRGFELRDRTSRIPEIRQESAQIAARFDVLGPEIDRPRVGLRGANPVAQGLAVEAEAVVEAGMFGMVGDGALRDLRCRCVVTGLTEDLDEHVRCLCIFRTRGENGAADRFGSGEAASAGEGERFSYQSLGGRIPRSRWHGLDMCCRTSGGDCWWTDGDCRRCSVRNCWYQAGGPSSSI